MRKALPGTPWTRARELCSSGRVLVDGEVELDSARRLHAGSTVEVEPRGPRRRAGTLPPDAIVHSDAEVVVVRKPAGCMTVPFEPGEKDTLVDLTRAALRRGGGRYDPQLGVVQRLDKDTTGLLVFTRTLAAKRELDRQFRRHSVERRYLAIAHGEVREATMDTLLVRDRGDGLRGSWGVFRPARGRPPADARRAITHVSPIERLRGATLVSCRLETGRQHQIRIHLSESGHPLVGERVYVRAFEGPRIEAPRPMLHAEVLGFVHPRTGKAMRFQEPPPDDFREVLERLRRR
ncbi:MAG: RluA family pseudouridine synthase [Deltaproteobacteria bacterium]|nr:RluA family pseudouridine synthase [Deltaproteobacteria bacterium]